ncbi:MAG: hypothetical protein KC476_09845 [Cyanobacteria bacterium HKST-UBA06]|nr:hypothetical protein [Cyanobacteria bacterium HKST-UBA05]MCA9799149.1 hypothetical protein [Cyanobacteria bacterium HKST-UBA04]MCA9808243.1 hypothetical protein [Cyanobacteria bacterium HKST-UBA06]MCA9841923.1 hypothetical protein [Cyanobacteria bacterium HKST-UBA03]
MTSDPNQSVTLEHPVNAMSSADLAQLCTTLLEQGIVVHRLQYVHLPNRQESHPYRLKLTVPAAAQSTVVNLLKALNT